MSEIEDESPELAGALKLVRSFVGIGLVIAGAVVATWTLQSVYGMYTDPSGLEVFARLVPDDPAMREIELEGKKIALPPGLFLFMAYGIGCFLLFIASGIGIALITGGVNLLQSSFRRLEFKMSREMLKLRQTIDLLRRAARKGPGAE